MTNAIKKIHANVDLKGANPEIDLLNNLRTHGCAVLNNHDVPIELIQDIFHQWKLFFSSNEKNKWLRTDETDEGYIPLHGERAKKELAADYKELYQTHYKTPLPTFINTQSTHQLFDSLVSAGKDICNLLDLALPNHIKEKMPISLSEMVKGSNNHILRVIHYPPVEKDVNIPRAMSHSDICLITTVFGATFRGLELQNPNTGDWYVPIVDNTSLVVFSSEMLELATDGYLKAVFHAVKANSNSYSDSRYSIPMGFHPRRNVELKKGLTAVAYLKNRLSEMGYDGDALTLNDY